MGLISYIRRRRAKLIAQQAPKAIQETYSFFSPKQQEALGSIGSWFAQLIGLPKDVTDKIKDAFIDEKPTKKTDTGNKPS